MTTLAEDLARIAAKRGKPLNYYVEREAGFATRRLTPEMLGSLFVLSPRWREDFEAYDKLPEQVRNFIANCPMPINACAMEACLETAGGRDEQVIDAAQAHVPGRIKGWLLRHYGADHPNVRKYP